MNTTENMTKMALAAMAGMGDVFTDSPECAHSVAAAENLAALASKLAGSAFYDIVAAGHLMADGKTVCPAQVRVDGSLIVGIPDGFDTSGLVWSITLATGHNIPVALFTGECGDDEHWVIDDADTFYTAILAL